MSTQAAAACATSLSATVSEDPPPCSQAPDVKRFNALDRHLLAAEAGIGARVIERMEEAGFHSLAQLRAAGCAQVVDVVCRRLGSIAWRNRLRPLERALVRADERLR